MTNIFVFGSNQAGRHGKGAALEARNKHGAIYGRGEGIQGKSYAIPTKDFQLQTLSLESIKKAVDKFKQFARENPDFTFQITAIGCGLAGYSPADIAPMFIECTSNCILPNSFKTILKNENI